MNRTSIPRISNYNLFYIELHMWVELKVGSNWVLGEIIDISNDGKKVWIETHEDCYEVNRLSNDIRKIDY